MSITQARNKLKGQKKGSRKDPPQILSLGDHTPPASIFLSNAGNHAHRNNLRSVAMSPQRETAARMLGSLTTAASTLMLERVQKRVLDKLMDAKTTPQTKRVAAKVHKRLPIMMPPLHPLSFFSRIYSLQEIADSCFDLQCAMD
jgi:hypothetical protein